MKPRRLRMSCFSHLAAKRRGQNISRVRSNPMPTTPIVAKQSSSVMMIVSKTTTSDPGTSAFMPPST
eukprot:6657603-Prymnesium_polylepis.2